ncbi:MAG: heme NO-binding domain-containing protein [Osedax symbiont Rs1]|nr:MAG: heme NO-binding domain-containing protein [Osedax symbiont Rs1]
MMGQIFTELLELVEKKFGYAVVDKLLVECQLPSKGIYTAVGVYSHEELLILVKQLSVEVDIPVNDLIRIFGEAMFSQLIKIHPEVVINIESSFDLLSKIDGYIHVEVFKLYPSAQLPVFSYRRISDNRAELHYQSNRPFANFAEGLLLGCAAYFNETFEINRTPATAHSETDVMFEITRRPIESVHA